MVNIDKAKIIYIDEAGIKLGANREYGYSEINTRVYANDTETSEHITLVAGLTEKAVVAPMTLDGYIDEDAFICYIQYFLLPVLTVGYTVIMDNLSSHKSEEIVKLIESKGAKIIYLPPYSPDLSPIELAWSKIKSIIRDNCPLSRDSLDDAFAKAITLVSSSDSFAYFSHCFKCLALI
jgi:transposase